MRMGRTVMSMPVALVLGLLVAVACGQSPPDPIPDGNRPVYVEGIELSVGWILAYSNETVLPAGTKIYSRVLWNDEVVGSSEIDAYDPETGELILEDGVSEILIPNRGYQTVVIETSLSADFPEDNIGTAEETLWLVPGAITLLPPIMVILVAVTTREVLYALYIGILFAAFIVSNYNPFTAFLRVLDTYLVESLGNVDHAFVILFTWFLSGLVACVSKSGGSFGIAEIFRKFARSRTSVQVVIFALGFVIFFDDYANTLILGNTMRVVSDTLWVSREKLAFLVDATTAPVASIAPISSWIGFEVGLIQEQIDALLDAGETLDGVETNAYLLFLQTIPSRFYPILMLFFQISMIVCRREFGPMLVAERRAQDEHKLVADDAKVVDADSESALAPSEDTPLKWWNGVIPIFLVIFLVLLSILLTGRQTTLDLGEPLTADRIFGNGDSYSSLMYGGFTTTIFSWFLYRLQYVVEDKVVHPFAYWFRFKTCPGKPLLSFEESLTAFIDGIKGIFAPVLVLILAWAIGAAVTDSGADIFFASALGGNLDPRALPVLTFVIAAIISFCTGTSWGTMSILFPLIVPTAWYASRDPDIFVLTISAILSGSVFGDHCTPISDTTILSSISSKCDVMHHTLTQLPYALVVGAVSIFLGYLPVGYGGYQNYWGLILGAIFSLLIIIFVGVRVDDPKRRVDVITVATRWCGSKCKKKQDVVEDEEKALEKGTNLYVYDEQYDREFVDILRRNFWNPSLWWKWFTCRGGSSDDGSAQLEKIPDEEGATGDAMMDEAVYDDAAAGTVEQDVDYNDGQRAN